MIDQWKQRDDKPDSLLRDAFAPGGGPAVPEES